MGPSSSECLLEVGLVLGLRELDLLSPRLSPHTPTPLSEDWGGALGSYLPLDLEGRGGDEAPGIPTPEKPWVCVAVKEQVEEIFD